MRPLLSMYPQSCLYSIQWCKLTMIISNGQPVSYYSKANDSLKTWIALARCRQVKEREREIKKVKKNFSVNSLTECKLFHDGSLYRIEVSPLICSCFYIIGTSIMKKLIFLQIQVFRYCQLWSFCTEAFFLKFLTKLSFLSPSVFSVKFSNLFLNLTRIIFYFSLFQIALKIKWLRNSDIYAS